MYDGREGPLRTRLKLRKARMGRTKLGFKMRIVLCIVALQFAS